MKPITPARSPATLRLRILRCECYIAAGIYSTFATPKPHRDSRRPLDLPWAFNLANLKPKPVDHTTISTWERAGRGGWTGSIIQSQPFHLVDAMLELRVVVATALDLPWAFD